MNSCIYEGQVTHKRFQPVAHEFTYSLFMLYLDLSELKTVFRKHWFWSTRFPNVAWFRRAEHLGDRDEPLDQSVRNFICTETGSEHNGPIHLLTHLRYFGLQMNPVSFFFCFDHDGEVKHIVAEVNNTPWGEQHCYLLDPKHFAPAPNDPTRLEKDFHVSPYMPMDMQYQWRVTSPGSRLNISISNFKDDERFLNVAMGMHQKPITTRSLTQVLFQYPFMTAKVFAGIYWQALRLWRKRVPFFSHPNKTRPKKTRSQSERSAELPTPHYDSLSPSSAHEKQTNHV